MIHIKRCLTLLLALLTGISLFGCSQKEPASSVPQGVITPEQMFAGAQVLEYNSLTGQALPEGVSAGQRPIAVMVNNAPAALPQRGVAAADAIVEMVTEGGITRLLALYSNAAAMPQVGPVRSARDQHVQFAIPANAILVHIGSSVYAENMLNMYTYQDIDGRYLGTQAFTFDAARATTRANEHCWYTDAALVAGGITARAIETSGKSYPLLPFAKEDQRAAVPAQGDAPDMQFSYADNNLVQFTYDAATGLYKKTAYGAPHVDEITGEQLAFQNVLVLFAQIGMKPDAYCADFNLTSGTGYYLYQGKYQSIRWEKGNPEEPLKIFEKEGKNEVLINPGKSYIGVVGAERAQDMVMDVNAPAAEEPAEVPAA